MYALLVFNGMTSFHLSSNEFCVESTGRSIVGVLKSTFSNPKIGYLLVPWKCVKSTCTLCSIQGFFSLRGLNHIYLLSTAANEGPHRYCVQDRWMTIYRISS